ncbi:MAG TPA: hypothetical protein VGF71_00335 [Caulobacteraceae bacterium]|jgi:hypothetical protein
MNHTLHITAALVALVAFAGAAAAQGEAQRLPLDETTTIGGIDFACTGIGQEKQDPRWTAFPAKVEFADLQGDLIADEILSVSNARGEAMATVKCEGPWILLRPTAPGVYHVKGSFPEGSAPPQSGMFSIPGHVHLVMRFPAIH